MIRHAKRYITWAELMLTSIKKFKPIVVELHLSEAVVSQSVENSEIKNKSVAI